MASPYADAVMETSVSTGTGAMLLGGAVAGYFAFASLGDGFSGQITIQAVDTNGVPTGDIEISTCTYVAASNSITRGSVERSSNANSLVNFGPGTKRVYVTLTKTQIDGFGGGGGSGTVTSVSVASANGVSGSVANPTTTPALTISLGAITPTSVNGNTITTGTGTLTLTTFTLTVASNALISGMNTGDQTNISGNAATVTTNANLTGPVTSVGNATTITNAAVTYAKVQNVGAVSLLGNPTGSPVPPLK